MRSTIYLAIAIAILFISLSDAKSLNKRKHHNTIKERGGDNGTLDQAKISGLPPNSIASPKVTRRKLQRNRKRQQPASAIPDTGPLVNGLLGGILGPSGPLKGLTPQTPPAQPYYYQAPAAPPAGAPPPPNALGGLLGGLYPQPPR